MISTTASVASYTSTASQTVFSYPFRIQNQSDLLVFTEVPGSVRSNITGSIVSVSGVDSEGGGTVTIPAQAAGTVVYLVRASTFSQLWDASALNFFDPATVERVVDKLTILCQEVKAGVDASIRFEPGEQVAAIPKAARAGKILAFDSNGNPSFINEGGVLYAPGDRLTAVSVADLKAISLSDVVDRQAVDVLGYYAAGDGGGGLFYYDSASSDTDNGGTILQPVTGSGRWKRVYSGAVNVRWFGAKGDGVIGSATTDDGPAFQAAIDFVYSKNGGEVHVPASRYYIATPIIIKPQVSLIGEYTGPTGNAQGRGAFIVTDIGAGNVSGPSVFRMTANSTIANIGGWYNTMNQGGGASARTNSPTILVSKSNLAYGNADGVRILNMSWTNPYIFIQFGDGQSEALSRFVIEDVFASPLHRGIYFHPNCGVRDTGHISRVRIFNYAWPDHEVGPASVYTQENGAGFELGNCDGVWLIDCQTQFYAYGIILNTGSWVTIENFTSDVQWKNCMVINNPYRVTVVGGSFDVHPGDPAIDIFGDIPQNGYAIFSNMAFVDDSANVQCAFHTRHADALDKGIITINNCRGVNRNSNVGMFILHEGTGRIVASGCGVGRKNIVGVNVDLDGMGAITLGSELPSAGTNSEFTYPAPSGSGLSFGTGVFSAVTGGIRCAGPGTVFFELEFETSALDLAKWRFGERFAVVLEYDLVCIAGASSAPLVTVCSGGNLSYNDSLLATLGQAIGVEGTIKIRQPFLLGPDTRKARFIMGITGGETFDFKNFKIFEAVLPKSPLNRLFDMTANTAYPITVLDDGRKVLSFAYGGIGQLNSMRVNQGDIFFFPDAVSGQAGEQVATASGFIQYDTWGSGAAIGTLYTRRANGSNMYEATTKGTTGATAPTHTSGTVSDGGVSWRYLGPVVALSNRIVLP